MQLEIIEPHGFCAGVRGAIDKAFSLPQGAYCLHEIVHNELVVAELKSKGVRFVDALNEVPDNSVILFSAHGVAPAIRLEAQKKNLKIIDATCPFVQKVHNAAMGFAEKSFDVVIIGDESHAEVAGIVGAVKSVGRVNVVVIKSESDFCKLDAIKSDTIGVVSQTTMADEEVKKIVSLLSERFNVVSSAQVCNATKERQAAVRRFSGDSLIVLGSANSSNTARLCEIFAGKNVFRISTLEDLKKIDFSGLKTVGITSGASTPESFFNEAIDYLKGIDE
jgi:4-hydroxy-3-methylbut-2-enyl diphosphate reductase